MDTIRGRINLLRGAATTNAHWVNFEGKINVMVHFEDLVFSFF